jgi:glycosyltransferase involved in cell wall biosynthesis
MRISGFSGDVIVFNALKRFLMTYVLEPLTILMSRKIYGISEFVATRAIVRLFAHKCVAPIYNLPPQPFTPDGERDIRQELGLSSTDIIAVSAARINKEKGYHILAEAIRRLRPIRNLKFVIVGRGNYLDEMRELLKEQTGNGQVFFLEYRKDIQRILHRSDIFVLPTLHETLSNALLEASVEGLALVASNTGGIPEIVESGYNGLLVTPGDADALTHAIETMCQNTDLRKKCSQNAIIRVHQKFSAHEIETKIDNLYKSLLNTSKR